jgi:hypothetical protein
MTRVQFPFEFEDPFRQKFTANSGTASSTITRLWELVVGRKATGLCCALATASTFNDPQIAWFGGVALVSSLASPLCELSAGPSIVFGISLGSQLSHNYFKKRNFSPLRTPEKTWFYQATTASTGFTNGATKPSKHKRGEGRHGKLRSALPTSTFPPLEQLLPLKKIREYLIRVYLTSGPKTRKTITQDFQLSPNAPLIWNSSRRSITSVSRCCRRLL